MSDTLDALYRDELLELAEMATSDNGLDEFDQESVRYNPLCGDTVKIRIRRQKNTVADVSAQVEGCIICSASAAIMKDSVRDSDTSSIRKLIKEAFDVIRTGKVGQPDTPIALLSGVHRLPNRVRCALLSWEALESIVK